MHLELILDKSILIIPLKIVAPRVSNHFYLLYRT